MLNPASRFRVDELPGVDVYLDHAAPARFYAVPHSPRLAMDATGRPQISLLLYGRGQGPQRQLLGGQVLLTTSLGLVEAEVRTLRPALVERLAAQAAAAGNPGTAPDASSVEILSPDWESGEVTARLTADIQVTGKPSLMGANECTLSATLGADQAQVLQRAWAAGLPDAQITYRVQVTAVDTSSSAASAVVSGSAQAPGVASRWTGSLGVQSVQMGVVSFPMTLQGPVPLSTTDLRNSVQGL